MTDFRGRVLIVSLVLLALAGGVLLGSGPLRTAVSGSGARESDALIAERDAAVADAQAAQDSAAIGERYAVASAPRVLANTIAGRSVAVVVMPGVDGAEEVAARVSDGGAVVVSTVTIGDDWVSQTRSAFREALAEQMADTIVNAPDGARAGDLLALALTQALVPAPGPDGVQRSDTLWTLLTEANLVSGDRGTAADSAIVVTAGDDESSADSIASALRAVTFGVVVSRPAGDIGRKPDASYSTVSDGASVYGSIVVVLALAEQTVGGVGSYGADAAPDLIGRLGS